MTGSQGKPLSILVLRAFELENAAVTWPFAVTLFATGITEQVDGAVFSRGLSCLIESKCWSHVDVNADPIHRLRSQLLRRPAGTLGLVFSRSSFTEAATTVAHFTAPHMVLLWNGDDLTYALDHEQMCEGLGRKYRYAVEHGVPDFELRETPRALT